MARKIYKYTLQPETGQYLTLPKGSQILSAKVQHERICLWCNVDVQTTLEEVHFVYSVPTGEEVPVDAVFIGTVLLDEGSFVLHIFTQLVG